MKNNNKEKPLNISVNLNTEYCCEVDFQQFEIQFLYFVYLPLNDEPEGDHLKASSLQKFCVVWQKESRENFEFA